MLIKSPFVKYHLPVILYCIFIFILSSLPNDKFPDLGFDFGVDKIAHIILYFGLCLCFFYSFKNQNKSVKLRNYAPVFAFVCSIAYGFTDEFHQYFVPNRFPGWDDILANTIGAVIGYVLAIIYLKRSKHEDLYLSH